MKKPSAILTAQMVREHFDYDPLTGHFLRKIGRRAGKIAGAFDQDGYRRISILGTKYRAHRLAWLWVHGVWPDGIIDHINHDRADNCIANLRVTTNQLNNENTRKPQRKHSKYRGVSWRHPWIVFCGGRRIGAFATQEEAALAYNDAAKKIYGEHAFLNEVDN